MKIKISFRVFVIFISLSLAIIAGLVRISDPKFVEVLRLKYFDKLQQYSTRITGGHTYTVIVDIDEKSLEEIGQWPWSRTVLAELFKKCAESGMLVLGLDILFAEPDRTSPNLIALDLEKSQPELANQLSKMPPNEVIATNFMLKKGEKFDPKKPKIRVVLGHSALNIKGDENRNDIQNTSVNAFLGKDPKKWLSPSIGLLANVSEFENSAYGAGTISLAQEPDGIIRRVPIV